MTMPAGKTSYPIHLDLTGRRVLVVGAGRVATRKIERLAETPVELRVVALTASLPVRTLSAQGRLVLSQRAAVRDDVAGCFLVITATDQAEVNARVAGWAKAEGALVSRVDAPSESDFTVPAFVRGAQVEATVSTYGEAPSASRRLKRELQAWVQSGPDRFASEVAALRRALAGRLDSTERLRRLNDQGLYEACVAGDEARIQALISAAAQPALSPTDSPGSGERT